MKRLLLFLLLCGGIALSTDAQSAKSVLDKASSSFTKKGTVKAEFIVKNFLGQKQNGQAISGNIILHGQKFKLYTQGVTTWFDGKTQWTYVPENEEVNVTEPTEEELQAINPYTFLNFYKKGFNAKFGTTKQFAGKAIYDVQLVAKDNKSDIKQVVVFVDKKTYQLLQIKFRQGTSSWMSITINSFLENQKYPEDTFMFKSENAPRAEIIDLR